MTDGVHASAVEVRIVSVDTSIHANFYAYRRIEMMRCVGPLARVVVSTRPSDV